MLNCSIHGGPLLDSALPAQLVTTNKETEKMTRRLPFASILLVATLGISGVAASQSANGDLESKSTEAKPSAPADTESKPDGDYVGSEVCVSCHAENHRLRWDLHA
jgi:hypothetical protein